MIILEYNHKQKLNIFNSQPNRFRDLALIDHLIFNPKKGIEGNISDKSIGEKLSDKMKAAGA